MKLTTMAVFGAGYVLGARAGRERYAQIVEVAQRTAKRLEERQARQDGRAPRNPGEHSPDGSGTG